MTKAGKGRKIGKRWLAEEKSVKGAGVIEVRLSSWIGFRKGNLHEHESN